MNPAALCEALERCLADGCAGLIVQPLEHPSVREAIQNLIRAGVPVVTILTELPGAQALGYVGLDNRAAGRAAGLLMGRLARAPGKVAAFWGGHLYRSHEEREMGFRAVLREEFHELTLLDALQGRDDPEKNYRMARELLETDDLRGIYSIGSGNRGIEKAMLESGRKEEVTYIAFNLTPLTRQCLMSGVIDAVVHQDMARAAECAVGALLDDKLGRPVQLERVPVEIIMRENLR